MEDSSSMDWGMGGGFRMIQEHSIYCALFVITSAPPQSSSIRSGRLETLALKDKVYFMFLPVPDKSLKSSWKTNHILFCGPWLFWRQWPSLIHTQIDPMLLFEASDPQNQSQKSLTFAVLKKSSLLKGTLEKAVMLGKESLTPNLCVIYWLFS